MVKIVVETFGEDALRKLYCDLDQKEFRWDKECELCKMPTLLHCDTSGKRILGSCTRISGSELRRSGSKLRKSWSLFRRKMRHVVGKLDTIEKQKVKEFELLEVSDKDAELVHEEGYDETINSNENIVAENNELIVEILLQEKTLTDNNIENERVNLECDKKTIVEQDKVDKIIEESLQDNCNVEIDAKYRKQDTNSEDTDKSQCSTETDKSFVKDRTEDSNRMFHENVPFHNLHNTTTESVNEDNLYVDPIAGDHIENLDENREETINGMEEEVLEKDNQYEDSSESYTVRSCILSNTSKHVQFPLVHFVLTL